MQAERLLTVRFFPAIFRVTHLVWRAGGWKDSGIYHARHDVARASTPTTPSGVLESVAVE